MRISDWSSDVCSSDLPIGGDHRDIGVQRGEGGLHVRILQRNRRAHLYAHLFRLRMHGGGAQRLAASGGARRLAVGGDDLMPRLGQRDQGRTGEIGRSEEHTSELQSLMRISYAV